MFGPSVIIRRQRLRSVAAGSAIPGRVVGYGRAGGEDDPAWAFAPIAMEVGSAVSPWPMAVPP
jgi:hypothetical protein